MIVDRLDELAVLLAILDQGSLAGAARRLRRSAAAVTRTLAALEARTGARLIERSTRRLSCTAAGRALAERARELLRDYASAVEGVSDSAPRGLLRVTAPLQFGRRHVAPIVSAFLDIESGVQIELVLNDRNLDLIEEGIDVAVRIGPLVESSLLARRVGEVSRVLVASPAYLARRGSPKKPRDLATHDTIFSTGAAPTPEWRFGRAGHVTIIRLAPRLLVNDVETQLMAARAGRGIARPLSYQVADDLASGRLVRLLPGFEPPPLPVHLVALSRTHMPPKVRAFLDYAARVLGRVPAIRAVERAR